MQVSFSSLWPPKYTGVKTDPHGRFPRMQHRVAWTDDDSCTHPPTYHCQHVVIQTLAVLAGRLVAGCAQACCQWVCWCDSMRGQGQVLDALDGCS